MGCNATSRRSNCIISCLICEYNRMWLIKWQRERILCLLKVVITYLPYFTKWHTTLNVLTLKLISHKSRLSRGKKKRPTCWLVHKLIATISFLLIKPAQFVDLFYLVKATLMMDYVLLSLSWQCMCTAALIIQTGNQ